jgi:hypothetical protein
MRNIIILFVSAVLFTACSSPKYSYYFDHYNYNSGKKQTTQDVTTTVQDQANPLLLNDQALIADANTGKPAYVEKNPTVTVNQEAMEQKIASMTKSEKKEFKKELKTELKKIIKVKKQGEREASVHASKEWDQDLKMAAIFGSVGVVLTILGGINTVFWVLGVVAFVIAVVFFIKWLARQ